LQYKEDKRVVEYVKDFAEFFPLNDGTKISASKFLERFAFTPEQQYTYLSKLSGGEKRRLQLLSILFKNPNFLVLDEPTNDLDLQTLQILEEFLLDFGGCILLVSHDRYFMDKLVEHLFVFEGEGEINDFPGNYSQYRIKELDKKNNIDSGKQYTSLSVEEAKPKEEIVRLEVETKTEKRKLSFNEKREFEQIEIEMPKLESEKKSLENKMSEPNLSFDDLQNASNRIGEIIALLEEKELRWLELSEHV
jgi:ATP-binding cassette subfamily F protein uup